VDCTGAYAQLSTTRAGFSRAVHQDLQTAACISRWTCGEKDEAQYLAFPEYKVAVPLQHDTCICWDASQLHATTVPADVLAMSAKDRDRVMMQRCGTRCAVAYYTSAQSSMRQAQANREAFAYGAARGPY